jgi:hypothetical protein
MVVNDVLSRFARSTVWLFGKSQQGFLLHFLAGMAGKLVGVAVPV